MVKTAEIIAALRQAGPDEVVSGQDAIRDWFRRHGHHKPNGAPLTWRHLLDQQKRVGFPLAWHGARRGRCKGPPISSNHLLIAWCLIHDAALGPPGSPGWKPASRTLRKYRQVKKQSGMG